MSALPFTAALALSALMLTTPDRDQDWTARQQRASPPRGAWLDVLVLLVLAIASTAVAILHPEAVAASFG
jgi:hypothetical protein